MTIMYRGAGPTLKTFDLTPRFYEQACPGAATHPSLQTKCKEIAKAAVGLANRTNCIRQPTISSCKGIIDAARQRQDADRPLFEQCKAQGQAKYNVARPEAERRSNDCAYEFKGTGGPNSKGTTWRKLLPGVCRPGTFVGHDGLDCCNGSLISDGPLGIECRDFYPKS